MKKLITLSLIAVCCASLTHAQVKVESTGRMKIGDNPQSSGRLNVAGEPIAADFRVIPSGNGTLSGVTNKAIQSYVQHSGQETSIAVDARVGGSSNSGQIFGVFAEALYGASGYIHGVFGKVTNSRNGAGIHGSSHTSCLGCYVPGVYAGYFEGDVMAQGSITATGTLNGTLLTPSTSAAVLNSSVRSSSEPIWASRLGNLSLNSYTHTALRTAQPADEHASLSDECTELTAMEKQVISKQHYGLDADQLAEVFPDLVYENEDGTKSINYVEMVPILVQAINELQNEIGELRGGEVKPQTRAADDADADVAFLSLGENKPNPFSATTAIPVSIPADVQQAFIYVYDLTGKKVLQQDISARGKHDVTLDASALADGMYLYSLIADGRVVQTRRMIVEK